MTLKTFVLVAALGAAAAPMPALTLQAWNWIEGSPSAEYTDQDWDMLFAAAAEALNSGVSGTQSEWSNPATGHHGTVTALDGFEHQGMQCRNARFMNSAGAESAVSRHKLCKVADGSWKILD